MHHSSRHNALFLLHRRNILPSSNNRVPLRDDARSRSILTRKIDNSRLLGVGRTQLGFELCKVTLFSYR